MKALFCTDGSNISYNAVLNFSKWVNNPIFDILNVFDLRHLPDFISLENNSWDAIYQNTSDKILEYSEVFFRENNLILDKKIKMCGSTIDNIIEIKNNYDFIIMGSNGKQGIQKWLGSVSQEISAISDVPIFISKFKNDAQKILFAVDYSEIAPNIISDCISNLNLATKEIYLVTAFEIPDYMFLEGNLDYRWITEVEKKQERESALLLNKIENILKKSNINIQEKYILKGNPAKEIISLAKNLSIDLVVTGSVKKKGLANIFTKSVSLRILENTNSDMLILKY